MRLNFIGNYQRGYVGEEADEVHLTREVERLGNNVNKVPRDIWKAHVDGLKNDDWNKYLDNLKADINIICKWNHFDDGKYIKNLREESSAPVFYWVWDYMADGGEDNFNIRMAKEADLYLSNEGGAFNFYSNLGIKPYYFPMDVCDGDLPVFENEEKIYDVVFPGSYVKKGDRIEYLKEINKEIPVKIFAWNHEEWLKEGFDASPAVYGADFNKMIAQSKVVLGFNVNAHCWGYWSNRVGKVLTVGGLLVQQYAPGMELLLPDCVSLFRNPQDLTTKIKNILEKSIYCPHKKHEEFTSNQRCYDLYFLITNYLKEGKLWNKLP